MNITIHVLKLGSTRIQAIEIAEEILIADLLQQILDGQHEQFDLFPDGRSEPHGRHQSAREAGIKHGDLLHCHPKRREIRVHIDQEPFQSPSVTTGAALYLLGKVAPSHQLYREVMGCQEDEPIFNDEEVFHLHEDSHFHSSDKAFKGYEIVVNGSPITIFKRLFSFDEIIDLAFNPRPTGQAIEYTVTFEKADGHHKSGQMVSTSHSAQHGPHWIKVKTGTEIDVDFTDRS